MRRCQTQPRCGGGGCEAVMWRGMGWGEVGLRLGSEFSLTPSPPPPLTVRPFTSDGSHTRTRMCLAPPPPCTTQRREYDSTDDFDDSLPTEVATADFYKVRLWLKGGRAVCEGEGVRARVRLTVEGLACSGQLPGRLRVWSEWVVSRG